MFLPFLKSRPAFKIILAIALTTGWLHAAPYGPDGMPIEWTQPDGSKVSLLVFGDEFYARTETLDGYTVVFNPVRKSYEYAKVGLTLLIDFTDAPATIPQANMDNMCNADVFTTYNNVSSVKKYFQDVSSGQLTYTNVVTAYIRMAQPKSYYNDTAVDCGIEGRKLISDAIDIMKALPNYNTDILPLFDSLTVNGSNQVVATNVFFAGADSGVWSFGLWPHSWSLSAAKELSAGGKKIYKYQITNIGTSPSIGTFCHENGHMLCGYPDLYDYGGDSTGGAGSFSLMGYNPSNTNGTTWTSVGSTTGTAFAATCYIGLVVDSGSDTTLNTSQFSNLSVTP